jgi:hypothetical protein
MVTTIEDLRRLVTTRRLERQRTDKLSLGKKIFISVTPDGGTLFLFHEDDPEDTAVCGFVEETSAGRRWVLWREWYNVLKETFGDLPALLVIDGEAEAA